MNSSNKKRRLFFAIWPTDQVRQSIADTFSTLSEPVEGRDIRKHNLHITLHFIGQVTEQTKDCMHHAALSVRAEKFQLVLDCFDHFSKARVLWMGAQSVPVELKQLHHRFGVTLEDCGYSREDRPYVPHVSLVRKYRHFAPFAEAKDFSIPWQVDDFVLVESVSDGRGVNYQVIEKYPLA